MKAEWRQLIKEALAAGATVRAAGGGGHRVLRFPNGHNVTISGSPSDSHAINQARRQVRAVIAEQKETGHVAGN